MANFVICQSLPTPTCGHPLWQSPLHSPAIADIPAKTQKKYFTSKNPPISKTMKIRDRVLKYFSMKLRLAEP